MCLYFMCNGYNLSQFLNLFASDCKRNDRLIVQLFLSSSTTLYSLYCGENESDSELSYKQCVSNAKHVVSNAKHVVIMLIQHDVCS